MLARVLAGCLVVGACSASPPAQLRWDTCAGAPADSAVRCATVPVAAGLPVLVARLPAQRPDQRIGVLVVNPGGPGASSVGLVTNPATTRTFFPQALLDRFDIVEVDGRGVGGTPPSRCTGGVYDASVTRFPATAAELDALTASNSAFATSCPGTIPLDTEADAADLDAVRAALGVDKISFLGLSYGSMLAQAYAEGYGDHVRAMAIDGVVDRSLTWQQLTDDGARAVEDAFQRFASWCDGQDSCGRDMTALVTDVLADADRGLLGKATAGELVMGINDGLHSPGAYPTLADALVAAHDRHDPSGLERLVPWAMPDYYASYRAIICQDVPVTGLTTADTARVRAAGPTLRGESEFWEIATGCAGWPSPATWTPHPWRPHAKFPGLLVVGGAHDPVTPEVFARNVAGQVPGSRLVVWDGDGHTAWSNDDATQNAEVNYLIAGR